VGRAYRPKAQAVPCLQVFVLEQTLLCSYTQNSQQDKGAERGLRLVPKSININPRTYQDSPICDLCFEDALEVGRKKSEGLKSQDFKETSIRFCVDGLYKWYKSFAKQHGKSSVFTMVRDASWWWSSFCGTDPTLSKLVKGYYELLKDITENTSHADLAERMDEAARVEKVGKSRTHFSLLIPFECHGVIADCAVALGMSFGQFYQLGLAKALASNRDGLYEKWVVDTVDPLFIEVMGRAKTRIKSFRRIRNELEFRATEGDDEE
jgi:hypothetical protein